MNEKIFINIASFRDPSLIITIKSALLHAAHPENLVFGIGAQYYDNELPDFSFAESQIKVIRYNPDTAPGVVKVRYEISQLASDEKYFLMIDSHVLFVPNWDSIAKEYLKELSDISGHERVCISGTEKYDDNIPTFDSYYFGFDIYQDHVAKKSIFTLNGRETKRLQIPEKFLKHHHVLCNNFFTYSNYLYDVGQDDQSNFLYEEPYLSWKTYVSGWDLYRTRDSFLRQTSDAYFNLIWNDDSSSRTYDRLGDSDKLEIDMFSAMIFNKSQHFSAKNQRRSSEDFWSFIGERESFKIMEASEDFIKEIKFYNIA
jgi:hypothetical protein